MARIVVFGGFPESLLRFRGELLNAMVTLGHKVVAIAPGDSEEIRASLSEIGVEYYSVNLKRAGLNSFDDLFTFYSLVRLFKKINPDIVLSYTIKPVIYGSAAARLSGVKHIFAMITGLGYIFIERNNKKRRLLKRIVTILYRVALIKAEKVFFQNPDDLLFFLKKRIISKKENTCIINGSGVNLNYFKPVPLPNRISFLLIARLLEDKGVREYVCAAKVIRSKYCDVRCFLVGGLDPNPSGISNAELQAWIKEGYIEYLGEQKDVRPSLQACSVYVLPSYGEGTPRTVLEAMAMGRSIITTDSPGCRETVKSGENGFLVPIKDIQRLTDAMEKFIISPELMRKMGAKSRKIAEQKYDVYKVNNVILKAMGLIDEKAS